MSRNSATSFLEEAVRLLVRHFGVDRVRAVLEGVSNGAAETSGTHTHTRRVSSKTDQQANPSISTILEQLRQTDGEKYRILNDFYTRLKEKGVLPESQDIRHFAQLIGLKEIGGKSRKDMIPRLMRYLLEQPAERLQVEIRRAADISEQQRRQGFSILTDKLVGDQQ